MFYFMSCFECFSHLRSNAIRCNWASDSTFGSKPSRHKISQDVTSQQDTAAYRSRTSMDPRCVQCTNVGLTLYHWAILGHTGPYWAILDHGGLGVTCLRIHKHDLCSCSLPIARCPESGVERWSGWNHQEQLRRKQSTAFLHFLTSTHRSVWPIWPRMAMYDPCPSMSIHVHVPKSRLSCGNSQLLSCDPCEQCK